MIEWIRNDKTPSYRHLPGGYDPVRKIATRPPATRPQI
jgi:hypothetical protein